MDVKDPLPTLDGSALRQQLEEVIAEWRRRIARDEQLAVENRSGNLSKLDVIAHLHSQIQMQQWCIDELEALLTGDRSR